jgi:hypothetical protein
VDHLLVYVREPTLWPVVTVAAAIALTLGVAGLLAAVVQRNPFAMAAIALLAGLCVDQVAREWRRGGPGAVTGLVCGYWLLAVAGAFALAGSGLF